MTIFTVSGLEIFAKDIPGAGGIAIANDGRIFIGAEAGWIYAITPNGEVSQYAQTAGRPLGLHGLPAVNVDGVIYVLGGADRAGAISSQGLLFSLKL